MQRPLRARARAIRVDPVDGRALSRLLAVGAEADGVLRPAAAPRPLAAFAPRARARRRSPRPAHAAALRRPRSCSSTAARTPGRTTTPASRHCGGSQTNGASRPPRPRRCPPAAWPSSTSGTAMATSTPPPADGASALPPEPVHERLDTLAAQVAAIDAWSSSRGCRSASSTGTSRRPAGAAPRAPRRSRASCAARATPGSRSSSTTHAGSRLRRRACATCCANSATRSRSTGPARGARGHRRPAGDRRRAALPAPLPPRPPARGAGRRRAAGRATAGHALRGDLGHRRAGAHRDDAGAVTPARARRGEARPTAVRRCGARLRGSARSPRPGRGGSGPCRAFRRSSRPTAGSRRA